MKASHTTPTTARRKQPKPTSSRVATPTPSRKLTRRVRSSTSLRRGRPRVTPPSSTPSCGVGTVSVDGTCIPAQQAFHHLQADHLNPVNNYSEIQNLLASKTKLDVLGTAGTILAYLTDVRAQELLNASREFVTSASNLDQISTHLWCRARAR